MHFVKTIQFSEEGLDSSLCQTNIVATLAQYLSQDDDKLVMLARVVPVFSLSKKLQLFPSFCLNKGLLFRVLTVVKVWFLSHMCNPNAWSDGNSTKRAYYFINGTGKWKWTFYIAASKGSFELERLRQNNFLMVQAIVIYVTEKNRYFSSFTLSKKAQNRLWIFVDSKWTQNGVEVESKWHKMFLK